MHQVYTADVINDFQHMFSTNRNIHSHLNIPVYHKNVGKTSIRYMGAVIWNNVLKGRITLSCSQITFKQQLKKYVSAGNIKDLYISHHDITLRDHVLCCQHMNLFYSMKFGTI